MFRSGPASLLSVWFLLTFFQPWAPIEGDVDGEGHVDRSRARQQD